jgi:class 3 adenylate cyclase/tRNA A-37 threonylcarbamoyl transferase component Bud32
MGAFDKTTRASVWNKDVRELLEAREEIERTLREKYERRVAVLFSDLVGSTAYYERHGDIAGRALVERHLGLLRPPIENAGGRVLKTIGDAVMAAFDEPRAALLAAQQMQVAVARHNRDVPDKDRMRIRVGVHYGEAIVEETDVFGDTVNVAARIQGQAGPDEILISAAARAHCGPDDEVSARGEAQLKGKGEPMRLFALAWRLPEAAAAVAGGPPDLAAPALPVRYAIESLIRSGAFAAVYRAQDTRLGRTVAIKVLHRRLRLDEAARERLRRQARVAGAVRHRNIVEVYDASEPDELDAYLVMEYVEGEGLRSRLDRAGPLGAHEAARLAHDLALGLSALHRKRIGHRDVEPENVLLATDGTAKLGGFEMAAAEDMARLTSGGLRPGTADYMAPELAAGEKAGPAADIYSLGVVLVEAATGAYPFGERGTPAAAQARAEGRVRLAGRAGGTKRRPHDPHRVGDAHRRDRTALPLRLRGRGRFRRFCRPGAGAVAAASRLTNRAGRGRTPRRAGTGQRSRKR